MDVSRIADAAEASGGVSGALSGRGGEVETAARIPPEMWAGLDADLAADLIQRQAPMLYDGSDTFLRSQRALEDLVIGLNAAKDRLVDAHDVIAGTGITIAADGTITTPVVDSPEVAQENARRAAQAAQIIQEALRMAVEADDRAVAALTDASGTTVDPGAIPNGGDPRAVEEWWDGLTPEQRAEYITQFPQQIGNLNGIPAADRDTANRLVLSQRIEEIERQLAELGPFNAGLDDIRDRFEQQRLQDELAPLLQLQDRLATTPSLPEGTDAHDNRYFLLGLDPNGDGQAIVAAGNPDTADNVVTYVPGMGTDLASVAANPGFDDINRIDRMRGDAHVLAPDQSTASILWLGYDAPDGFVEAGSASFADAAAVPLQDFQEGLRATHEGAPSNNTLLGHSYGSTAIGHAAQAGGVDADSLVIVGSPGTGADDVSELNFDPERVYATRADNDFIGFVPNEIPVTPFPAAPGGVIEAPHGVNPAGELFGANVFDSAPGTEGPAAFIADLFGSAPGTEGPLEDIGVRRSGEAHSEYWEPGNPSRDSIGLIVVGRGGEVGR